MYQPEKLKARRKELQMTQKDIADRLGISYQAYSAWERGVKQPSKEKVQQLEQILNVPKGYFTEVEIVRLYNTLSDEGKNNALSYVRGLVQKEKCKNIVSMSEKLYEYHVYEQMSAGIGSSVYNDQNYDTVYFDKNIAHDLASWVYGDSMEPDFADGSVALIKDTGWDYDGAIYAVDWDGQSYIKKVYKEKDGLRLVSLNDKYDDKFARWEEEPRIIGKVVGNFMPQEK